jgi:serine/threonine protein kinase
MTHPFEGSSGIPGAIGKYSILGRIARGGMAEVFLGRMTGQAGTQRIVAIKRILPHLTAEKSFVDMFIDEARISAQLDHSHIGQILDFGMVDEAYFLAMEYVHGLDLKSVCEHLESAGRRMPVPMASYIAASICSALQHAHAKTDAQGKPLDIIHRDVSPQNVLVGFEGEVKLIDFGIARAKQRLHETLAASLKGKIAYMSPEQAFGRPVDRRTDIFGAGLVLFELLTGRAAHAGEIDLALLDRVREGVSRPPSALVDGIPPELERVCMRALATLPEGRYASAGEMQRELERFSFRASFGHRQLAKWMKHEFADELLRTRQLLKMGSPQELAARANDPRAPARPGERGGIELDTARSTFVASESLIRELGDLGAPAVQAAPAEDAPPETTGPDLLRDRGAAAGAGARPASVAAMGFADLARTTIDRSMVDVTQEELHLGALAPGPRTDDPTVEMTSPPERKPEQATGEAADLALMKTLQVAPRVPAPSAAGSEGQRRWLSLHQLETRLLPDRPADRVTEEHAIEPETKPSYRSRRRSPRRYKLWISVLLALVVLLSFAIGLVVRERRLGSPPRASGKRVP